MYTAALVFGSALILATGCGRSRLQVGQAAEGEIIEVVGEATIDQSNILETKQRSMADAQKKAVEMVVGVHVSARTLVEKAVQIQSNILARTDGYIKKYDVIKEWQEPPLYKTRIRAFVSYQQIADDLKALGLLKEPHIGYPRVAVLLQEDAKDIGETLTAATNAMVQSFLDKGYRVVDRADLMAAHAQKVADDIAKGDASTVSSLGKKLDAEILIFGSAKGQPLSGEGLGGMFSYRSTLSAQAYKAQTNEVLLTASKVASGLDSAPGIAAMKSLSAVGKMTGEEMAARLLEELTKLAFITVTVSGVSDFNRVRELEKVVSTVPGVGDSFLRSFGGGRAHWDVQMQKASSRDIAGALERATAFKAKAQSVTQDSLEIALEK